MALTSTEIKAQVVNLCGGNLTLDTVRSTAVVNAIKQGYIEARVIAAPTLGAGSAQPSWFHVLVYKSCLWQGAMACNPNAVHVWKPLLDDYHEFVRIVLSKIGRDMDNTASITAFPEE